MKIYKMSRLVKILIGVFAALFLLFVVAVIWRYQDRQATARALEVINNTVVDLDMVMGKNLPPAPDKALNDSTLAGIDANKNGVRDDVELAIFEKYPDSAKIRSAMLQYAQALQLELTQVFNSETLVPVLQKEDYGSQCIAKTGPKIGLDNSSDEIKNALAVTNNRVREVEDAVLNTGLRKNKQSKILKKYMTTYSTQGDRECDIDFSVLPN